MTDLSARLALPLLQPGQAQKELFHNEALTRIDVALHLAVATIARDDPPAAPLNGEAWIIGGSPSGAWTGRPGEVAAWTSGGWRFVAPIAGMSAWLADEARHAWHDGTAWHSGPLPTGGIAVDGEQVLGPRKAAINDPSGGTTVDAEARTTIAIMLAALRDHGLIDT